MNGNHRPLRLTSSQSCRILTCRTDSGGFRTDKLSNIVLLETYLNDGWEFAEKSWTTPEAKFGYWRLEWMKADVPGHVHLDLVHNGVIADPYERLNELGCHWIDEKSWCYRTSFTWSASEDLPRRILRFEGLDTVCKIS